MIGNLYTTFRSKTLSDWFLLSGICLMYVQGIWTSKPSQERTAGTSIVLFTLLMIIHIGCYWMSFSQEADHHWERWSWLYFLIQGGLVLAIGLTVANDWFVIVGLYFTLIGQAIAFLQQVRLIVLTIGYYLALFGLTVSLQGGWSWVTFRLPLLFVFPMALFVTSYVQMRAREQTQALLRELEDAHARVTDYAERIEELTRTAERQRLARELHDTLAQGLAGLVIQLEVVDAQLINHNSERARELVQETMRNARGTLTEARHAIDDLRTNTKLLDDLSRTVQEEIYRFISATGIACTSNLEALKLTPPSSREHVLRMITECLANVARHARASHIMISTYDDDSILTLEVCDNGCGFDPDVVGLQTGHYGLLGIRERARLAGGQLEIKSARGEGTRIQFQLPLTKKEDE